MRKLVISVLFATVVSLIGLDAAYADVGEIEICNDVKPGTGIHDLPLSANVEAAQSFTLLDGATLTGVKLPLQRIGSPSGNVTVRITEVTINDDVIVVPDIQSGAGVLLTQTISKLSFPEALGTSNDQVLICSFISGENPGGTIIEFTTPIFLAAGSYALVVDATSTPGDMQWAVPLTLPSYAFGECSSNLNADDENVPDDWVSCYATGNFTDSGFVIFNNVQDPTENNFDSWLDNFLTGINMNSPVGKLIIVVLFSFIIFFLLTMVKVHVIISLGITGLIGTMFTAALILSPAVLLGMIAIVGLGAMGLIFAMFIGGGDN